MDKTIRQVRAGQEPPDLPIDMAQPDDMATPWGDIAWAVAVVLALLAIGFVLGGLSA